MKKYWLFALAALLFAALACKETDPLRKLEYDGTKISYLTVIPPSGTGNFTLEVTYQAYNSLHTKTTPGTIYCNYVTPDMATMPLGVINPAPEEFDMWITMTTKLPFSVTQANGVTQPGTYLAGCKAYDASALSYSSTVSTTFTVVAGESAPTLPPEAPPPEPPKPPPFTLTGGTITYDETSEVLSPHKDPNGYYPSQHHKWCNPILSIDTNGNISGTCSSTGDKIPSDLYGTWNGSQNTVIQGTLTGKVVPGGSFTFQEELRETGLSDTPWEYTRKAIIVGTGLFASPTRATGTATITIECSTLDPSEGGFCGDYASSDSYTGAISWEFNGSGTTP